MPVIIPPNNSVAFAGSGLKDIIPQEHTVHGRASMRQGFPEETMRSRNDDGVPPRGRDMNGILHQLSSHQIFLNAGGMYRFDATYAASIGGYAVGSVLQLDDGLSAVICSLPGNQSDPNINMEGWAPYAGMALSSQLIQVIYPVGIIIELRHGVHPDELFPGTSWTLYGSGQTTVGYSFNADDPEWTKNVDSIFGEYNHQLVTEEMPRHVHRAALGNGGVVSDPGHEPVTASQYNLGSSQPAPTFTSILRQDDVDLVYDNFTMLPLDWAATGGTLAHNNVQPSIVVARWCRIA